MLYSDRNILNAIEDINLVEGFLDLDKQIQPASIDLTLSPKYIRMDRGTCIEVGSGRDNAKMPIDESDNIYLQPGDFILGSTNERVNMPAFLVGRVDGRSSLGRIGITVHITAGILDPGFSGSITLEIKNLSRNTIILKKDMRICQIIFEECNPSERPYSKTRNKYQGQDGPQYSLIEKEAVSTTPA